MSFSIRRKSKLILQHLRNIRQSQQRFLSICLWCVVDHWPQRATVAASSADSSQTQHTDVWFWLGLTTDVDEKSASFVRVSGPSARSYRASRLQRGRRRHATSPSANTHGKNGTRTSRGQARICWCDHRRRTSVDLEHAETRRICYTGWVLLCMVSCRFSLLPNLSQYITSHPGQLNLAIPPWIGAISTSQRAVMPCGCGVKAGMVREWVAGETVWSPCYHGPYLSALAMGSSHNRALYKCAITLLLLTTTYADRRNESSRLCHDVFPSVCLSGTGVHCDHTVHSRVDLSLWLDSPMFWTPWH